MSALRTERNARALLRFYNVYQFIAPLVFFPIAYWLWWRRFGGDHRLASLIMFVPVVSYYLLVGLGVMRFRMWRFNTWPTIRGMRPHHGFVISTAAALFFYLCLRMVPVGNTGLAGVLTAAFLGASVFGFWNWWYETYAIKSGFISIYTKLIADGATAEEAVTDYAPFFFGSMGACYGAFVKTAEDLLSGSHNPVSYWTVAVCGGGAMIVVPVVVYMIATRLRHGYWGLKSYADVIEGRKS
jgi:hypothetical protein